MSGNKSWLRRLAKLDAGLPLPPAGAPYWLRSFEVIGAELGLAAREPDFPAALAAYRAQRPPYGTEAAGVLHDHLCELGRRALDGVPACSAAEFAQLAAWLAEHGATLPTVNGWKKDIEVGGGETATLSGLAWQVARGVTADGSGEVAETIRRLKAKSAAGAPGEANDAGGARPRSVPRWTPSVVRDDPDPDDDAASGGLPGTTGAGV